MNSSQEEFFIAACPGCGKKYRLPKSIVGKQVKCKACQYVWRVTPADAASGANAVDPANASQLSGLGAAGTNHTTGNTAGASLNGSSVDDDFAWIGRRLGRFQIVEVLGKGAMGVVFRAHDPDLKRDVALKILAKQFIRSQKKTYRLEQFIREARSAARLSHPHTVIVYEIGQDQGWYFIAMELVEGKTLLDLVRKKRKRVPIEQVCELIAQAAEALSAAHKLGIVHRDIKPSNLMLTREGRIKVADFGLAQLEDREDDFELPTKAVGTPYWMPPEQGRGQTATAQSDIYALGAVLFFTLTGEVPFRGNTKKEILDLHAKAPVPDPRALRKDIPEGLVRIIQRAMAKNPGERQPDAMEMAIGLRQIAHNLAQSRMAERWWGSFAASGAVTRGPSRPTGDSTIRNLVVFAALLLALLAGALWWRNNYSPPRPPPDQAPTEQVVDDGPKVPVYAIRGERLYHVPGCFRLEGVPEEKLVQFKSHKVAEDQGLAGCSYCDHIRRQLESQDAGPSPATSSAPAPRP